MSVLLGKQTPSRVVEMVGCLQKFPGYTSIRLFSSSQPCFRRRRDPTEAELQEMTSIQRWYYRNVKENNYREVRAKDQKERYASLANEPEKRERLRRQANVLAKKSYKRDPKTALIRNWLQRLSEEQLEAFSWKTHFPVVYPQTVRKPCGVCHDASAGLGSAVWWRRIQEPEIYDCHLCHMKNDVSYVMPEGHEDYVVGSRRWPRPGSSHSSEKSSTKPRTARQPQKTTESDSHKNSSSSDSASETT